MKKKVQMVSIGDCCADIYPKLSKVFPGGTAFNVAVQAHEAGADTSILSAIGTDSYADLLHKALKTFNVDTSHLRVIRGKTSHVEVKLDNDGKHIFSNWELGVLKKYLLNASDTEFINKHDVARIVLFKPIADLFEQFCALKLSRTLKVVDFAGSSMYSEGIKIIEQYIENLDIIVKSVDERDASVLEFLKQLASIYKEKIVIALLGKNGSVVYTGGKTFKQSAIVANVKDTNGAGDAYVAHFLVSFLETQSVPRSMLAGAKAAGYTIRYVGAIKYKPTYTSGVK